jgi:zinc transporter 1
MNIMIFLIILYFFAEVIVGIIANSLTLIADSFHMISDGLGLMIGGAGIILSKKSANSRYSYGFGRSEIVGALINGVFLATVSVFILLDAIQRFIKPEPLGNAILVLSVGGGGMLLNIFGMIMFCV